MADIKFEEALKQLEQIVEDLENGELDLDKSIDKFEIGINLTKSCVKRLNEAEKKIEILIKQNDGSIKNIPFEGENGSKKQTELF